MRMPVWFAAEYIGCDEGYVRWLITTGELVPEPRAGKKQPVRLSEREVRRWMREHGYPLSDDDEPLPAPEPQPPPPNPVDALVPMPEALFMRIDAEVWGALLARAYLRTGKKPPRCPLCCPGWLADHDCLHDDGTCIYYCFKRV